MPFKGAKPISDHDSLFDGNSDDSSDSFDFIVEDDGSAVASLPMEFSMDTHQDLVHQFKKIFQFFVHIAVRTPGERHNLMEHQMKGNNFSREAPSYIYFLPLYSGRVFFCPATTRPPKNIWAERFSRRFFGLATGVYKTTGTLSRF